MKIKNKTVKTVFRFIPLAFMAFVIFTSSSIEQVSAFDNKYDAEYYASQDPPITMYNPEDSSLTCGEKGSSVTSLSGKDNREKIWNFLTASGLSSEQAAGVLGNIQTESASTFSPTIHEIGTAFDSAGYGIVQWTGGRRDTLVAALKSTNADLMSKYYNQDYSTYPTSFSGADQGFLSKSASTGAFMPVADNDALLLTELNFLYQESNSRTVSSKAVAHSSATAGETEWNALKNAKSVEEASNIWVYSFEVPADIDNTAKVRANYGNAILTLYQNGASGSTCSQSSDNKKQLATDIIATGNVSYWSNGGLNSTEKIITGIADGSNNGNDWPCGMNLYILKIIYTLAKSHKIVINDTNRACTNYVPSGGSRDDLHYNGNGSAIDLGPIDGVQPYTSAGAELVFSTIGSMMVTGMGVGQSAAPCVVTPTHIPSSVTLNRFADSCTHLHIDVPPDLDPSLKCEVPVFGNRCSQAQVVTN